MADELGQFKSQPWIVFDTIASRSMLVGETRPEFFAAGTAGPAITNAGEMIFFSTTRTRPTVPWYTSLELVGQLSYGFKAWAAYVYFGFPPTPAVLSAAEIDEGLGQLNLGEILAQAIINFGVLEFNLGQEQQASWPVHRFQGGGGVDYQGGLGGTSVGLNAIPTGANVLKLPEPIEIARTQNLDAKIKLAPEVLPTIGSNAAPGAGYPIDFDPANGFNGYEYFITLPPPGLQTFHPQPPYTTQVGFIGERIKKTQYGQVPGAGA